MNTQRFLLGACFVCLAGSVLCAYFAIPEVPEVFVAEQAVLELGDLRQAQEVAGTFQLTNKYRQPLEIVRFSESCGCSTVGIDSKLLQPGHQAKLKATWKTGSSRGIRQVHIWVEYRVADERRGTLALAMRGTVIPDCEYEPSELVFEEGVSAKKTVQVRPGLWKTPMLERGYASHRAFKVDLVGEREVTVEFDPAKWEYPGHLVPYLGLHTNCPNERLLHIDLKVNKGNAQEKVPAAH